MTSLIGKALAVRDAAPIPFGESGFYKLPGLAMGSNGDEPFLRAYGVQGTVFSNVSLLASSTAKPDWRMYRKAKADGRQRYTTNDQGSDQRVEVVRHQALAVLSQPNPFWSRFALMELGQTWMELAGKCHLIVEYDPRASFPVGLWPVRPDRMTPVPDRKNFLAGWVYTSPDGSEKVPLLPREVIFNRYPDPLDLYGGTGPVQSVLVDIDAGKYAAEWSRNYFINSAEPGGVIESDHSLDDGELEALQDQWRERHRGVSRAHRIAVLEMGLRWVPNAHSPKDMDFANLRTVSRDVIREAFGMHKVMTGVTDDVNRANAQTGEEVFSSWKVSPRLDRWKDVFNWQFLPLFGSAGTDVEFDYVYPMPQNREQDNAELTAKTQGYLLLVQGGVDPHDALTIVGLPDATIVAQVAKPGLPAGVVPAAVAERQGQARSRRALTAARDTRAKVIEQLAQDYPAHAMAWAYHADWTGPARVPLGHIQPDLNLMDGADPAHVADFTKMLEAGKKLKPVILVKTPGNSQLQLVDGHHRYLACAQLEEPCRAWVGTTDADHGPWDTMHDYQLAPAGSPERGRAAARRMAAWNQAGAAA